MLPSEMRSSSGRPEIRVIVRDLHHETQVGANHQGARFVVAFLDFGGELDLLLGGEQRDLPDLAQINLYSSIAIFSSHITFHVAGTRGASSREFQLLGFSKPRNLAFLALLVYLTRLNIGFMTASGCVLFNVFSGGAFAADAGPDCIAVSGLPNAVITSNGSRAPSARVFLIIDEARRLPRNVRTDHAAT